MPPIQEIFLAAIEIDDLQQRADYVARECGDDPALHRKVQALLTAHERSGEFLDVPAIQQMAGGPTQDHQVEQNGQDDIDLSFLQPSSRPDSLGRLLHYEVTEVVGRGGCGFVLKAFDEKLHRVVAIKMMMPELAATSPARKRFLREARATAAIRHDNVVSIHAVEEQPLPFLVMEYIDGRTLQDKINATGPLEVREVVSIGRQIACGLEAAHAQGLIHRDIKPANILLENGSERPKITDFGLARSTDDASLTRSGVISGTPLYMSPEQAQGVDVNHRSDLFSLGSVLYVMCSGRPPFRASTALAVLKRVVEEQPRAIREILPDVPEWLIAIIARLHAKKPEERFSSAREVAELLDRSGSALFTGELIDTRQRRLSLLPLWRYWSIATVLVAIIGLAFWSSRSFFIPHAAQTERAEPGSVSEIAATVPVQPEKRIEPKTAASVENPPATPTSYALSFDGVDDYVLVPTLRGLGDQPVTVELILKTPSTHETLSSFPFYLSSKGGERMLQRWGTDALSAIDNTLTSQPFYNHDKSIPGQWLHVAAVYGDQQPRLYINGQKARHTVPGHQPDSKTYPDVFLLAGKPDGSNRFLGDIHEVRVSRIPRYTASFTPPVELTKDDDTLALYLFREGGGNRLVDSSGNGHHGEIHGSPEWVFISNPDRKAAEYTLSIGGFVQIDGNPKRLTSPQQLPVKPYQLTAVNLLHNSKVTVEGLKNFSGTTHLRSLELSGVKQVTDESLVHFRENRQLDYLGLASTRITGEGLKHFQNCQDISILWLNGVSVTDDAMAHIAQHPKLKIFGLWNCQTSDRGLSHLANHPGLVRLEVPYTTITDESLKTIATIPNLSDLTVMKTSITDEGLRHLKENRTLKSLTLDETTITDKGLRELVNCSQLRVLSIRKTGITQAGVEELSRQLPECEIKWNDGIWKGGKAKTGDKANTQPAKP